MKKANNIPWSINTRGVGKTPNVSVRTEQEYLVQFWALQFNEDRGQLENVRRAMWAHLCCGSISPSKIGCWQTVPWPVLAHQVCPAALQESASSPRSNWASDWLSWPKGLSSPWVYRDHDCGFPGVFNTQGHKRLYLLNFTKKDHTNALQGYIHQ